MLGGIFINIGIDSGGRHVGMGIVDEQGNIIKKEVVDYTKEMVEIEEIFEPINRFIEENTSDDIDYVDDEETAEASLGATSIADVHIYTTPTLIKITDGTVTYYSRDYYEIKSLIEE